jgi:hypothetical protein
MLLVEAQCRGVSRFLIRRNSVHNDLIEAQGLDVPAELLHQYRAVAFSHRFRARTHQRYLDGTVQARVHDEGKDSTSFLEDHDILKAKVATGIVGNILREPS